MRRVILPALLLISVLLLVFALLLPVFTGDSTPAADGQVRVEQLDASAYPEIDLFVSVRDAAGNLRGDLGSDDFAVTEDGQPVEISAFAGGGAGGPLSAALVIDRSGSMEDDDKIEGARAAALAFVEQLRPGDQAAILGFNSQTDLLEGFTDDQASLRYAIESLDADGGTALYDAVVTGVDQLRELPGRRVLLVLADGQDCRTPFDGCPNDSGSSRDLDEAIAYAEAAGQPVYVVGLGDGNDIDEPALRQIADGTGGRYFYAPRADELAVLYADVAGAVQQEYRLTYVSPRPFYDGTRRDIQVSVAGVTAGTGYTERHLINVVSNPLVGLVLLGPLAGLLVLPGILRRRRVTKGTAEVGPVVEAPVAAGAPPIVAQAPEPKASLPASSQPALVGAPARPAPVVQAAAAERRCTDCAAPLRPGARFCSRCGATQPIAPAPVAERRSFCDMCGGALLPGAQFCTACGEPVARTPVRS